VLTSRGHELCSRARVKNRRLAARSRFSDTSTSMTCRTGRSPGTDKPTAENLDIRFIHKPLIPGNVPAGHAASISSGVNRCTPAVDGNAINHSLRPFARLCANSTVDSAARPGRIDTCKLVALFLVTTH
jgi:hypothetical protein